MRKQTPHTQLPIYFYANFAVFLRAFFRFNISTPKNTSNLKMFNKSVLICFQKRTVKTGGKMAIVENLFYLWKQKLCLRLV